MSKNRFQGVGCDLPGWDGMSDLPAWAWPGGYPIAYYTNDGVTLCGKCANKETMTRVDAIGEDRASIYWPDDVRDLLTADRTAWISGYDVGPWDDAFSCDECNRWIQEPEELP